MLQVHEISLVYKAPHIRNRPTIVSSSQAQKVFYENWSDDIDWRESFYVIFLNRANKVKGLMKLSSGSIDGTLADIRIIMGTALKSLSTAIALAHNHPSGNLAPSGPDKHLTKKIKEACDLMDINLLDHLILDPDGGYFSFVDEGLL